MPRLYLETPADFRVRVVPTRIMVVHPGHVVQHARGEGVPVRQLPRPSAIAFGQGAFLASALAVPPGVARIVPPVAHAARELRGAKVLQDVSDRLGRTDAVFASRASTQESTDDAIADGFAGVLPGKLPDPRQPIAELAHVDLAFVVGSGNACRVGEKPIGCGGEPRSVVRSKVGRVFAAVAPPEGEGQGLDEK